MSNENERRLIAAAKEGNVGVITNYMRNGLGNIDCLDAESGNTALIYAAENGHEDIVELLLCAGSDVNIQNRIGNTALMRAAASGHVGVVQILARYKSNLDSVNIEFDTAFTLSCANGRTSAAIALIQAGCNHEVHNNGNQSGMSLLRLRYPDRINEVQVTLPV